MTKSFAARLRTWTKPARPAPARARPPALYEQVVAHPNPLGFLHQLHARHPHSMPVGVDSRDRMLYTKPETTFVGVGPARAIGGKSASISTPVAIEHDGPTVVMSLRSDALRTSAAMRSLYGNLYMFNPDGLQVPPGVIEMRWSPLVGAEDLDTALVTARAFVKSATVIGSDSDTAAQNTHFTEQGGVILGVLDHFAAVTKQADGFRWVCRLISQGDLKGYDDILGVLDHWPDRRAFELLSGVLSMPGDRELGSIQTTLNVAMSAYQTETALRSTDNPNLDPRKMVWGDSDADNPWLWTEDSNTPGHGSGDTLYLIAGDKPISAAINVAIVTQMIEARHDLHRSDEENGNADAHPDVLFCLDEMANMPLPQLPELLAAPGRGCLFTGQLQGFSQLVKWGNLGPSMVTQMQQLVVFRGIREMETLRLIETLCPTVPTERIMAQGRADAGTQLGASSSPERLPAIPAYRIYSGINNDPSTVLYLGADGASPDWIHIRPFYSDPMLLHVQVKALAAMALGLHEHDPRRLLPLPELTRGGDGYALMGAGGWQLANTYQMAMQAMRRNH